MKISYDSTTNRYIVAYGTKVMDFSERQFATFKTMADLQEQFHARIIDDENLCYNYYRDLDEEE